MARASTFTSYINSELPTNVDANFARFESIATRTYGNVARAANAASTAAQGVTGRGGGARGLEQQARAARAIADVNGRASSSSRRLSTDLSNQGRTAERVARQNGALVRNLNALSTSLNVVQGPLGPLAGRVAALGTAINQLSGFRLGLAGVAGSLFLIGQMGNTYTQLTGQIAAAYEGQSNVNHAISDVVGIANRARTSIETITGLYIRLGQAADSAGISQQRAARVTELAAKAATLSGGSKVAQDAALTQFTQAVGANFKGGGQELQSILEGANQLAVAIAKGLGVSVSQLKKLGEEGKLSAEVVFQALERSAGDIETRFARMPKTMGQATTEFTNNLMMMIGTVDHAIGFTGTLASIISAAAHSMNFLASAAAGVAIGFAAIKLGGFISETATAIRQQQIMYAAVTQLGIRRLQNAEASLAQHQREQAALEAEQQQIRETIVLLEAQAQAARDARVAAMNSGASRDSDGVRAAIVAEKDALTDLNRERTRGSIVNDAATAANGRLHGAQTKLATATSAVASRTSFLRSAVGNIIGSFNFWGIAIAAVTTALISMATRASFTEQILSSISGQMMDSARTALGLAAANREVAASYYEIARAAGKKAEREAREKVEGATGELSTRVSIIGERIRKSRGGAADGAEIVRFAEQIKKGTADLAVVLPRLRALQAKYPQAFRGGALILGTDTNVKDVEDNAIAVFAAQQDLNKALKDQQEIETDIARQQQAIKLGGPTAVGTGNLRGQAQADAIDDGTSSIRNAGIRRRNAYIELDKEFGVTGGKVPVDKAEDYRARSGDIERMYNTEVNGVRAAAKAKVDGARSAARAMRVQEADEREAIEGRLSTGLLDLETRKPTLSTEEYTEARLKLLRTYDAEIQALDQMSPHSSKAAAQMIRDVRNVQAAAEKAGERRQDILGQWSDEPKGLVRARDQIEDLNKLVDTFVDGIEPITKENPLGTGLYTQAMADGDARRIMQGVRKPLRDANEEHAKFVEISALRLNGLDAEANALQRALDIQDRMGEISKEEFANLVGQERQQQAINDLLEARGRLTGSIQSTVQQTRDAFEGLLTDIAGGKGTSAVKDFINGIQRNINQLMAKRITERLFAGADDKVRQLMQGQDGIDRAYALLANHSVKAGGQLENVATAAEDCAEALKGLTGAARGEEGGGSGAAAAAAFQKIMGGPGGSENTLSAKIAKLFGGDAGAEADILVTGRRDDKTPAQIPTDPTAGLPTGKAVFNTVFRGFGEKLDKIFGTGFFKKVGGAVGTAFEGAGQGSFASGIAGMLGIKQSSTGAAIGGALGNFIPGLPPGVGSAIGGLLGGTFGGMLMKTNSGRAGISMNQYGEVVGGAGSGYGKDAIAGASGASKSLADAINQITGALGANISGLPGVTIGSWNDRARVALTGTNKDLHSKNFGPDVLKDFGDDMQAAIEYAIRYVIGNAVISGISQASVNILKSGQDLQQAIQKATAIESIPKRLMQRLDPVRYAVSELNSEFTKLISYLKEGGATAQQFADAQKLYDLERADAIKQATEQAVGAIEQFMNDMIGSSASPLNKRTVYENAQSELGKLATDVNAGKIVDQNDLLTAAKNFQDASRGLYGSSQSFFTDFQMLYDLLAKAKGNVLDAGAGGELPGSPFTSDSGVTTILTQGNQAQLDATNRQTDILAAQLSNITDLLRNMGVFDGGGGGGGALRLLQMNQAQV